MLDTPETFTGILTHKLQGPNLFCVSDVLKMLVTYLRKIKEDTYGVIKDILRVITHSSVLKSYKQCYTFLFFIFQVIWPLH